MVSNILNTLYVIKDQTACVVFSNISPKENLLTVSLVCKVWNLAASYTAKALFIEEKRGELSEKMGYFLHMTRSGLEAGDYFPILKTLENKINERTPEELHEQLNSLIVKEKLITRYCLMLNIEGYGAFQTTIQNHINFFRRFVAAWAKLAETNPQLLDRMAHQLARAFKFPNDLTMNEIKLRVEGLIPRYQSILIDAEQRKEDLFGKPFANFFLKKPDTSHTEWIAGGVCMFPIELFNFHVQGGDHAWAGPKSGVTHCFPLHGRLYEVDLIADQGFTPPERAAMLPVENLILYPPQSFYEMKRHGMPPK